MAARASPAAARCSDASTSAPRAAGARCRGRPAAVPRALSGSATPRAVAAHRRAPRRPQATAGGEQQPREAPTGADSVRLLLPARPYAAELEALEEGEVDEEELVAKAAMGLEGKDGMSDVQRRYAGKIAETLQEKAAAIAERQRSGSEAFVGAQFLYERGRYDEAVVAFEAALKESGEATQLGGDIALWLALAYDASGKREACLALYKRLEDTHSSRGIRKQASELRYILEAPQLEIRPEERITIPVPDDATQYKCV
jgi:RNA exonuclease 1